MNPVWPMRNVIWIMMVLVMMVSRQPGIWSEWWWHWWRLRNMDAARGRIWFRVVNRWKACRWLWRIYNWIFYFEIKICQNIVAETVRDCTISQMYRLKHAYIWSVRSRIGYDHFPRNMWLFAVHPPYENYDRFVILDNFISFKHTIFQR